MSAACEQWPTHFWPVLHVTLHTIKPFLTFDLLTVDFLIGSVASNWSSNTYMRSNALWSVKSCFAFLPFKGISQWRHLQSPSCSRVHQSLSHREFPPESCRGFPGRCHPVCWPSRVLWPVALWEEEEGLALHPGWTWRCLQNRYRGSSSS